MKKDNINNITGNILSELRKSTGLTQKEFAKVFNVSEGTIAHYEQGITVPNPEMLSKFADYFHVSTDYLIGRCRLSTDYSKLNDVFYNNMTFAEMINLISSFSKEKRDYLYQTLMLLNAKNK